MIVERVNDFLFSDDFQERYLIKNSNITFAILFCYITFVKWMGPALMKNRKAFDLKYVMIAYNFMLCYFNAYVGYLLIKFVPKYWYANCMTKYRTDYDIAMEEIKKLTWLLLLIKYTELADTVLFVLRKKTSQVSFLHIFHHSTMIFIFWMGIRTSFRMGYFAAIGLMINTCIHVVMYFYYGLSAFGPSMKKYLWWKRYLTQLQMAQFVFVIIYMLKGFLTGCEELGPLEIVVFVFAVSLTVLFFDFYRKDKQQ